MEEIYAYEFNFVVNVVFPLVMFLGGFILNNYLIYRDRKRRIQKKRRKELERQIKWERIAIKKLGADTPTLTPLI